MTSSSPGNDATSWVKSSLSNLGNCFEVARLGPNLIGVRNSRTPEAVLHFTNAEWKAFVQGVRIGDFDHLA